MKRTSALAIVLLASACARHSAPATSATSRGISEASVRSHMEFLASDAMNGRAGGTRDEWIAATYVASQLRRWGLEPMGDDGGYVQTVRIERPGAAARHTWNAIGRITGTDPKLKDEVILLSAHIDHLPPRPNAAPGADDIFNGADDDASGSIAVLELAEALSKSRRPKRTIVFSWFGSEERGGLGSGYFVDKPVVPLDRLVAQLQFEMLARPDPKVPPHTLWLTGYERSNLGAELAKRGAKLVQDPHPTQSFFTRSDNIRFARRGVIAHTVSSYGLHKEYHSVDDEIAMVDFAHMTDAIRSMVAPITWLANTDWKPTWNPGGRPQ